jgi:hypothetical protein
VAGVHAIGSLHWLQTISIRWLTWDFAHKRRGREAMNAANILPNFRGLAILPAEDLDRFHKRYMRIVEDSYAQNPVPESSAGPKRRSRRKQSKARKLLDRFRNFSDGLPA